MFAFSLSLLSFYLRHIAYYSSFFFLQEENNERKKKRKREILCKLTFKVITNKLFNIYIIFLSFSYFRLLISFIHFKEKRKEERERENKKKRTGFRLAVSEREHLFNQLRVKCIQQQQQQQNVKQTTRFLIKDI